MQGGKNRGGKSRGGKVQGGKRQGGKHRGGKSRGGKRAGWQYSGWESCRVGNIGVAIFGTPLLTVVNIEYFACCLSCISETFAEYTVND